MGSQTTVPPQGSPNAAPPPNALMNFMPMVVIIGIVYFLLIRPQQKQEKERRKMIDDVKSGDRVLTQGGLYGTVTGMRGPVIQLKISENVKVDVNRNAITQVLTDGINGASQAG